MYAYTHTSRQWDGRRGGGDWREKGFQGRFERTDRGSIMGWKRKLVAGRWSLARETVYCKGKTLRASTKAVLSTGSPADLEKGSPPMSPCFRPSSPCRSYTLRFSASDNTWKRKQINTFFISLYIIYETDGWGSGRGTRGWEDTRRGSSEDLNTQLIN